MPPVLIDTNLLIYLFDQNDPSKQSQAMRVLRQLATTKRGRLSVQNLAEFLNASVRKLSPPMSIEQALMNVSHFNSIWHVYDLTSLVVLEAGRGVRDFKLSYYDAQIWATAKLNQVPVVFSEDFNDGQTLEGVSFVNPFGQDFVLEDWV
jgi:predicted nucleic acid-binding protein